MSEDMTEPTMRTQVLRQAETLVNGERQAHYGPPKENFTAIAGMWMAYLGHPIRPADVCNMMALLKIARLRNGAHYDSSVDGAGYLALGAEMAEEGKKSS
jgi:hypothetical protein